MVALDCFDDFYNPLVKRNNINAALRDPRFTLVEGDIRDDAVVASTVSRDLDVVVHLAARAGVRPSIDNPLLYQDVNVRGTAVLLEQCRINGITRFIFGSSSSVYGNNEKIPFAESDRVDHPISPYAATKKAGELLCYTYHHLFDMNVTCLRLFTVYGPRQRPDLAIHKFAQLIEKDQPIPVFGDGSMMRDFTYVDDIVDGIMRAIDKCEGYAIYNIGESEPVSVNELVSKLGLAMGKTVTIDPQPLQPGDVRRTYADISLAQAKLGYQPQTRFAEGLAKFVEWFRAQRVNA